MPVKVPQTNELRIDLHLPKEDDPEQEAYVKVRAATIGETEERETMLNRRNRQSWNEDGQVSIEYDPVNMPARMREEAYLTLTECNLVMADPYDATKVVALFRFRAENGKMKVNMTRDEFKAAWSTMPDSWAKAIHDAVLVANPNWKAGF